MFSLKRSALRLLASPSTSFISKPRSISTISPLTSSYRLSQPTSSLLTRRWNSTSADKQESDAVTSAINAANEQSTTKAEDLEAIAESQAEAPAVAIEDEPVPAPRVTDAAPAAENYESNPFEEKKPQQQYQRRERREPRERDESPKPDVYVGNLFFDVSPEDLKAMCEKFGTVLSSRLIYDSKGLSKGFGYVQFETVEAATRAVEELHQTTHEGRRIVVSYAHQPKSAIRSRLPPSNTLFVGNMAYEMTDRDLRDLFRGIEGVKDVRVAVDRRTGQPRGFCHAQFNTTDNAVKGMETLRHKQVYGRRLRLDFSAPSRDFVTRRDNRDTKAEEKPVETQEQAEEVKEETEDVKVQV